MKKRPFSYQQDAYDALLSYLMQEQNFGKNPLVSMATGTGKSLVMAMFVWGMLARWPHLRMMQVTHAKELIAGNYGELMSLWPAAPAGVYSAGLGERNTRAQVTFAGIQSVHARPASFGHIDFLLVDEAHTISANEKTTYMKFIAALRTKNPNLIVIGFTATPFRMTSGLLVDGDMFDEVVYDIGGGESFVWAVDEGYLIRPVPKYPGFQLDSDAVRIVAGDFDNRAASQAMQDQDILERAVDTCIALGTEQGRQSWLHFCQSIEDAELVADMFTYKGHPHEAVHSKRTDRDEVLKVFAEGGLRGVTNKNILTTGYNNPAIDLIGMLRLTRSPGLWVQMIGRGTRPIWMPGFNIDTKQGRLDSVLASPKQTCLVLDFVGNTSRLGPINYPRIPARRGKGAGGDMTRLCPKCETYCHISNRACPECGYAFPPPERLQVTASESPIIEDRTLDLSKQPDPKQFEVFGVSRMYCSRHSGKGGKPDTMRVDYSCDLHRYSAWVGFDHPGGSYPYKRAIAWWEQHNGAGVPASVEEALEHASELHKPKFLRVWVNTKYPEIVEYDFRETRFQLPPELGGPPLQEPTTTTPPDEVNWKHQLGTDYDDDIPF